MTARRLYEQYTDALAATKRVRWSAQDQCYSMFYPDYVPAAWSFLTANEQATWKDLAKRLTPKSRKA